MEDRFRCDSGSQLFVDLSIRKVGTLVGVNRGLDSVLEL